MKKNGNEFTLVKTLDRGQHQYKFIVDGLWCTAPDLPTVADGHGNLNNFLDTNHATAQMHSQMPQMQVQARQSP